MTVDVVKALIEEELVEVTKPTKVGEQRGWAVAEHIVRKRLPLWCVAANLDPPPEMPPVEGFDDLPVILATLRTVPTGGAIYLSPDMRTEGVRLAHATHVGPLRAVETALGHAQYPEADQARLCEVQVELERLLPALAALALARHAEIGEGEFDLGPWQDATAELAKRL